MLDIDRLTDELVACTKAMVDRQLAGIRDALSDQIKANASMAEDNKALRAEIQGLTKRLDDMPIPRDGIDGAVGNDGRDGKDGIDGQPGDRGEQGETGQDGKTGRDGIDGKAGADGRDGVGIAETLIDRAGNLILTMTDGTAKSVGMIVGRDGVDGLKGVAGDPGRDGQDGHNGRDGEKGIDGQDGTHGRHGQDADMDAIHKRIDDFTRSMSERSHNALLERIDTAIKAIPAPQDGKAGIDGLDGLDGKDADPEQIKLMVAVTLPGMVDNAQAVLSERIEKAIADMPVPKDGKSVTAEDVAPMIVEAIDKAVSAIPAPKDGRDGVDGLGFDDMRFEYNGERSAKLIFERGDEVREHEFRVPALIDKGVWKMGTYEQGDVVTQGGSIWIAKRETQNKPGHDNDDWRLSVKRGRDAKPVKPSGSDEE